MATPLPYADNLPCKHVSVLNDLRASEVSLLVVFRLFDVVFALGVLVKSLLVCSTSFSSLFICKSLTFLAYGLSFMSH